MTSDVSAGMLAPSSFFSQKPPCRNPEGLGLLGEEGCTFPLPLWSSNRRESGETETAHIREGMGIYGTERGGRLQISPPI